MKAQSKSNNSDGFTKKRKMTFFVKPQMDGLIDDLITELAVEYKVKLVVVTDLGQLDTEIGSTDICWFDWCDELVIYASKMDKAKTKQIILRLRNCDAFTEYLEAVNWVAVDTVIFETEQIRKFVLETNKLLSKEKTVLMSQGLDVNKYIFADRTPGFSIAYVGNINYEQGPMLLLQVFKRIYDEDSHYRLYIAGDFQEPRYILYFQQMLKEMGLEQNVFHEGQQDDVDRWLEDKNYIISSSLLEGHLMGIMQGMVKGLKPLIHNFVGAKEIYPDEYIWNTIDDCLNNLKSSYNSQEYRDFIQEKFSLARQVAQIKHVLKKNDGDYLVELSNRPLVTIGIINYNGADYIEKCINSFAKQSYSNLEFIVIDDKSKDASQAKILKLKKKYSNIKVIFHEVNSGGMSRAIQEIIANANGKYVQWIASDDFVTDGSIRKFVDYMECNSNTDYVYSNFNVVDAQGNVTDKWIYSTYNREDIVSRIFHTGSGLLPMIGLFRVEFFRKNDVQWLIYRNNDMHSDLLNTIHFMKNNLRYEHLNEELICYRLHENNISYSVEKRIIGAIATFDYIIKNFDETVYLPEINWFQEYNRKDLKNYILAQFYCEKVMNYLDNLPPYIKQKISREADDVKYIFPFVEEAQNYINEGIQGNSIFAKNLLELQDRITRIGGNTSKDIKMM